MGFMYSRTLFGGVTPSGTAGGDLSGSFPNPDVANLSLTSEARGDLPMRGAANWARLAPGAAGTVLTSAGAGADLTWGTPAAGAAGPWDLSGWYDWGELHADSSAERIGTGMFSTGGQNETDSSSSLSFDTSKGNYWDQTSTGARNNDGWFVSRTITCPDVLPYVMFAFVPAAQGTDQRWFFGWVENYGAGQMSADDPAKVYAGFQFSAPRPDTNWQFIRNPDGASQVVVDTGIAVGLGTFYGMVLDWTALASLTATLFNAITGAPVWQATYTTSLPPTGTNLRLVYSQSQSAGTGTMRHWPTRMWNRVVTIDPTDSP